VTQLADDVLDQSDAIVPPGTNVKPADAGYANPVPTPVARRR